MHKHKTHYAQSTVCKSGFYERIFSNKFLSSSPWAYAGFSNGGSTFWGAGRVACRKAAWDAWRSQAFARGVLGHVSQKKMKWCNLVRFGAYFHKYFT